jgi:hypothetical protein
MNADTKKTSQEPKDKQHFNQLKNSLHVESSLNPRLSSCNTQACNTNLDINTTLKTIQNNSK